MDYKNFRIKINQILEREILETNEITSLEMVILMNDLNEFFDTEISIFELIEVKSIKEIYDLYCK
tara:strand:+ start:642 stop:836 length:195 start_codon:yes stop_codon:yes gene_type:complete